MSGYLLDTSVISLVGPGKPPLPDPVTGWLRAHADELFVPAVAVAEIEKGICKLRRAGSTTRVDKLSAWLDALIQGTVIVSCLSTPYRRALPASFQMLSQPQAGIRASQTWRSPPSPSPTSWSC